MEVTFIYSGVAKVQVGRNTVILDGIYTTSNEAEIARLRQLQFKEAIEPDYEVVEEPKPKLKAKKKRAVKKNA